MPNKYAEKKGWKIPKQRHKVSNWSDYNQALRQRGDITVWLSEEAIAKWYEAERVYDGSGAPKLYSDFAIITCHEIRLVYKLPLRQCQGFIDALFRLMNVPLSCPDFSVLSKRLRQLKIHVPPYKKANKPDRDIHAIAVDSTGLKRFGRSEWHQEKYELSNKASWRKLHIGVNQNHYIEACDLTDRYHQDNESVERLLEQVDEPIDHFSGDGAYDKTPVYEAVTAHSPAVDIVIPTQQNAVENEKAAPQRNRNLLEIKTQGRMAWQRARQYGRRNYSELAVQRYKRIIGDSLHAREWERQQQEAMLACGVLNKMTSLGMPQSYRSA